MTLVSLVLGYPLAHWLARIRSRLGYGLLLGCVIAPMLTGIDAPVADLDVARAIDPESVVTPVPS